MTPPPPRRKCEFSLAGHKTEHQWCIMRRLTPILAALALAGCGASLQNQTAEHLGCEPSGVEVVGELTVKGIKAEHTSWIATCSAALYVCTRYTAPLLPESVVCARLSKTKTEADK